MKLIIITVMVWHSFFKPLSMIAGATGCTRHKLSALTSSSSDMSSDNAGIPGGNQVVETQLGQNIKGTVKEVGTCCIQLKLEKKHVKNRHQ